MFEMRRLFKKREKLVRDSEKRIETLRTQGATREEIESARSEEAYEYFMIDEEIRWIITRKLRSEAQRHFLPLPPSEERFWERGMYFGKHLLTDEGIKTARNEIYDYRKKQIEIVGPILATLIGLLGATTGLLAVVLR